MKRFLLILIAGLAVITSGAKTPQKEVQPFEGALRVGPSFPLGTYKGMSNKVGPNVGLDFRFNYDDMPLDFGVSFDIAGVLRKESSVKVNPAELRYTNWAITATSNYNFRQGHKINPYAGIGLGYIGHAVIDDDLNLNKTGDCSSFLFTPRIGVELLYHIRIDMSAMICRRGFHCLNLNFGLVIGGRPRKSKIEKE
ncbi:MAG: outer membrane beta-barrel protein [Muribaculaceae bacterium]|nr:outer membrane beta-barrel protein [Muribaculaceae bacterium]